MGFPPNETTPRVPKTIKKLIFSDQLSGTPLWASSSTSSAPSGSRSGRGKSSGPAKSIPLTPCSKSFQTRLVGPNPDTNLRDFSPRRGKRAVLDPLVAHEPSVKPLPMIPGPDPAPIIVRVSALCSQGRSAGSMVVPPHFS